MAVASASSPVRGAHGAGVVRRQCGVVRRQCSLRVGRGGRGRMPARGCLLRGQPPRALLSLFRTMLSVSDKTTQVNVEYP